MPDLEKIHAVLDKLPLGKPETFLIFIEPDAPNFQDYATYLNLHTQVKVMWEDSATIVVVATPEAIKAFLNQENLLLNLSDIGLNEATLHTC